MVNKTETKKTPVATGKSFGVSVAIWDNTNKAGTAYKNISMSASTKQPDGTYKPRTIFFPSDLENLITALTELKTNAEQQGIKTKFEPKQ
jgi:hypothetical protein